jgi:hypothetical protein
MLVLVCVIQQNNIPNCETINPIARHWLGIRGDERFHRLSALHGDMVLHNV